MTKPNASNAIPVFREMRDALVLELVHEIDTLTRAEILEVLLDVVALSEMIGELKR